MIEQVPHKDNQLYNLYLLQGIPKQDTEATVKLLCNRVVIWLGKALDQIAQYTFQLYASSKLQYKQTRVTFSDRLILYTIKLMQYIAASYPQLWNKHKEKIIKEYDNNSKEALEFLMKKYPLKEGGFVQPELNNLIPAIDRTEDLNYQMLHLAGFTFDKTNINTQIKRMLNYWINLSKSLINDFRKDMREVFTVKKDDGTDTEIHNLIGMKFSENIEQFSETEVNDAGIKIKGPEILRVLIKWIEGLENRCKDLDKYIINRYYPFMTKKGGEKKLTFRERDALATSICKQFQQVKKYDKKISSKVITVLFDLFDFIRSQKQAFRYIQQKQVQTGLFTHILSESISSMAAQYLQQLIMHICQANQQLKLITFNVSDLLRSKCAGDKKEIRQVFDKLSKAFTVVRVKNRLHTSNHDFLVNFSYKSIMCEVQLGIVQKKEEDNQKQERFGHFSHFLYELSRSKFSALTQAAIINNHLNPMIIYFRQKISQKRTNPLRDQQMLKSIAVKYQNNRVFISDFEPRENTSPQFCNFCCEFKPAYSSFLDMFENPKKNKKICGECYIEKLEPKQRAELLIGDLSEFFQEVDLSYLNTFLNFEEYYILVLFKTYLKKVNALHKPKGMDELCDVFIKYDKKKYQFYNIKNLKRNIFFVFKLKKELRVFKDPKRMFYNDKNLIFVLPKVQFSILQPKQQLIYVQNDSKILILNNECTNELKRQRYNIMKMKTLADKEWWVMEGENIDEAFFENRKIRSLLPHISKLEVSDNRLKELGFLAKNSLFYLNVSGNQIASIDLRDFDFSALKYINLSKNLIQVIRLYNCNLRKLQTMLVYRNKLNVFDFCQAQLPALQLLHLDNNRISDVGNFNQAPLGELVELKLEENLLTTTDFLNNKRLDKLKLLSIENNKIVSLEGLYSADLPEVEKISMGCVGTLDLKNWNKAKLPKLMTLDIKNGEHIQGLKMLGKFYNLRTITLQQNKFRALQFGDFHLKYLQKLTIVNNSLEKTQGLRKVTAPCLDMLDFRKNQLTHFDFGNLNFAQLIEIHLQKNRLTSLQGLQSCSLPKMRELHLEQNNLQRVDLRNAKFPDLSILFLNKNQIKSIEGLYMKEGENNRTLCKFDNLVELHLEDNQLDMFCFAQMCFPNLEMLYLQKNRIRALIGAKFSQLGNLQDLFLNENELEIINIAELQIPSLRSLHLLKNRLKEVRCSVNTSFVEMVTLDISYNQLRRIDFSQAYFPKLQTLLVTQNHISEIGGFNQSHFPQLRILNITSNQIPMLKLNHFHFSNLQAIYLDKNLITKVDGLGQAKLPKLHTLSLPSNHLTEVNFTQADLPALTKFDIRNNKIEKVYGLGTSNTFNLKSLQMEGNLITQVDFANAKLDNLESVELANNMMTIFDAFTAARLTNLKRVNLYKNTLVRVDLTAVELLFLQTVNFQCNKIQEVELAGCHFPRLTSLNLKNNRLKTLNGLNKSRMPKLEELLLEQNQLTKIDMGGVELQCLSIIDLRKNRLESINLAKAKLPQLRILHLSERNRLSLLNFQEVMMQSVQILYFQRCGISKIQKFDQGSLPKLRQFYLQANSLSDLVIVQKHDMLEVLNLSSNLFENLDKLKVENLINLRHLVLSKNRIARLNFKWFKFSSLEVLDLSDNVIEEAVCLNEARMPNLAELNLQNNKLRKISFMHVSIHRLSQLLISYNKLDEVEGLNTARFTNLQTIDLSNNRLRSINFSQCILHNIEQIILANNHLVVIEGLDSASINLSKLRVLDITGNDQLDKTQFHKLADNRNITTSHLSDS